MPVLPSYRNQLIDLHSKLIDWFLYEDNAGERFYEGLIGLHKETF